MFRCCAYDDSSTVSSFVEDPWKTRLRHFLRLQVFWHRDAAPHADPVPVAIKWMSWQALALKQRWIHDALRSPEFPKQCSDQEIGTMCSFFNKQKWPLCEELIRRCCRDEVNP